MLQIEMFDANEGDALLLQYGPDGGPVHHVLVDCGRTTAYRAVAARLREAEEAGAPLHLDLFILTHVDDDHIYGAVRLIQDDLLSPDRVDDVWFNGFGHLNGDEVLAPDTLGARKGEFFGAVVHDRGFRWNTEFSHRAIVVPDDGPLPTCTLAGGMELTLLSPTWPMLEAMRARWSSELAEKKPTDPGYVAPGDWKTALNLLSGTSSLQPDTLGADWTSTFKASRFDTYAGSEYKEDDSEPNGSSIAVLAEFAGQSVLLCGDAYSSVLIASVERLKKERGITGRLTVDAVKLPHHGSKKNLDRALVKLLDCRKWLVSTNGAKHHHPNPEAIARVIASSRRPTIYFNHLTPESRVWRSPGLPATFTPVYGKKGYLKVEL